MMVNLATEDGTVSEVVDVPFLPFAGMEFELGIAPATSATSAGTTVYTVERVRYQVGTGEAWCLLKAESGGGGGGKKPKKPHPWKDK